MVWGPQARDVRSRMRQTDTSPNIASPLAGLKHGKSGIAELSTESQADPLSIQR